MQGRKLTKICGLVSAWAFVFLMVMPSVIAASPSIEKVDVDFNGVDITITIEGIDFTDELTATLGTDLMWRRQAHGARLQVQRRL